MNESCSSCAGTGYEYEDCELCGRNGWVDDPSDGGTMVCTACCGDAAEHCKACDGTGLASEKTDEEWEHEMFPTEILP